MSRRRNQRLSRLDDIHDWEDKAREAGWKVSKLAELCQVSRRTLEHWFLTRKNCTPKQWLMNQQIERVLELLLEGLPLKHASTKAGFEREPTNKPLAVLSGHG